jgi:RNase P/RNase MRP subunit p29
VVFVASNPRKRKAPTQDCVAKASARKQASPKEALRFLAGELIGEKVAVEWSSCKGLVGVNGTIADETQNTFVVQTARGEKRIPKKACSFFFPKAGVKTRGRLLAHKPEDRTKRLAERR